jgi:hypothetical protein
MPQDGISNDTVRATTTKRTSGRVKRCPSDEGGAENFKVADRIPVRPPLVWWQQRVERLADRGCDYSRLGGGVCTRLHQHLRGSAELHREKPRHLFVSNGAHDIMRTVDKLLANSLAQQRIKLLREECLPWLSHQDRTGIGFEFVSTIHWSLAGLELMRRILPSSMRYSWSMPLDEYTHHSLAVEASSARRTFLKGGRPFVSTNNSALSPTAIVVCSATGSCLKHSVE